MYKYPITGSNYKMRNIMIALCMYPWEPPHDLFSHGLCYHGNFGDIPISESAARLVVYRNTSMWDKDGFNMGT